MQVKTILNRIQKYKSFVYGAVRFIDAADEPHIEVDMWHRANSKPVCSGCGGCRPGYDRLAVRRFEFVPQLDLLMLDFESEIISFRDRLPGERGRVPGDRGVEIGNFGGKDI